MCPPHGLGCGLRGELKRLGMQAVNAITEGREVREVRERILGGSDLCTIHA